ncbi:MAG: SGNH/GDSL hydrolase family protein [Chloroflexota bacterium]|nr:SGNH/GDSL hydrolase family protein [Chloroflexota bacterium]
MMRRLVVVIGLAVVGFGALIGVELFLLSRREFLPSDPGYRVEARVEPATGAADAPALRLAVLGDSTVAGVGSPTEAESLPVLIAQRVADRLGRPVQVKGFGVPGARSGTLTFDQLPLEVGAFDVAVLVIGSNDATHATPWPEMRRQTVEMLEAATAEGARVILAGTPRFSGTEIIPEPLRTMVDRYSGILRGEQRSAVAEFPSVRFVDLAADASPRFEGRPDATSSDGFHPSPIGYGFWADAIAPAVAAAAEAG